MRYRRAVFIVNYYKEKDKIKYLLLKRKLHWKGWEFPKGGIEKGRSILETIKRETKEETNQKPINIKEYPISGKYKYSKKIQDRPDIIGQSYLLFSVQLKSKKINVDKIEHQTYKWTDYKTALKFLTWSNQRKCLRYVNKSLTKIKKN